MPGVCESDQGFERLRMTHVARPPLRALRGNLKQRQCQCVHPGLRLHVCPTSCSSSSFLVFIYIVGPMVPSGQGRGSSSSSRRPLVPDSEEDAQLLLQHKILAVKFIMAAKMRYLGMEDDVDEHRVYYYLKLAENLLLR